MNMRHTLLALILALPVLAWAAEEGGYPLDHAPVNLKSEASLQRGAKLYVNYCQGCHSAQYMRYNRFAQAAGLNEELVQKNLIFTPDTKIHDHMINAMHKEDATKWFGAAPPDLTLIARARSVDYLYTYLRTFYLDDSRPWGVNNAAFPQVGMPNVLWQMQGWQKPVYDEHSGEEGEGHSQIVDFELVQPGSMTPKEFDDAMADLVTFLVYISEPIKMERQRIGYWVLFYLVLATVVFYLLKREYWKDVH